MQNKIARQPKLGGEISVTVALAITRAASLAAGFLGWFGGTIGTVNSRTWTEIAEIHDGFPSLIG